MPTKKKAEKVESALPPVEKMVDLNAELEKKRPTADGLTGYLRARIKAGK